MNQDEFAEGIKITVREGAKEATISFLEEPVGRLSKREKTASHWFKELELAEKKHVECIIQEAVDFAIFGFLCVLDGADVIESGEEKSDFKLYAEKGGKVSPLNPPGGEDLHDCYNYLIQQEAKALEEAEKNPPPDD